MSAIQKDETVARHAQVLEIINTVFDVACHNVPECSDRWRKVQEGVKQVLRDNWEWGATRGTKQEI